MRWGACAAIRGMACVVAAAWLAACGSSGGSEPGQDPHLMAVAGRYVIDLERSIAAIPASGITPSAAAERDARLRAAFAAEAYSLDLETDGTFRMTVRRGQTAHVFTGGASASGVTVQLTVTAVDGESLSPIQQAQDTLARDGDDLILTDGGRTIHLARP